MKQKNLFFLFYLTFIPMPKIVRKDESCKQTKKAKKMMMAISSLFL